MSAATDGEIAEINEWIDARAVLHYGGDIGFALAAVVGRLTAYVPSFVRTALRDLDANGWPAVPTDEVGR